MFIFTIFRSSSITSSRISSFWIFSGSHGPIFEIFVPYESAQQENSNGTHINTLLWRKYTLSVIFQKSNMFDNSMIRGNFLTKLSWGLGTCDADSNAKKFFENSQNFDQFAHLQNFSHFYTFLTPTITPTPRNSVSRANFWCLTTWAYQFFQIPTFY